MMNPFLSSAATQGSLSGVASRHPHRPMPEMETGHLVVDPEIALKAKGFNLQLEFFYTSESSSLTEWGLGRSASVRAQVVSSLEDSTVEVRRGDQRTDYFQLAGSSGGVTTYTAATNLPGVSTLVYSGGKFTEIFPDGMGMEYAALSGALIAWLLALLPAKVCHFRSSGDTLLGWSSE